MTNAYAECYLDDAMTNLGEAFDYAVNACCLPLDTFWDLFVASGYADGFNRGNPRLVSGLSGTELVMETLTKVGLAIDFPEPRTDYGCSAEYWCGWALAYYSRRTGRGFRALHAQISGAELLKLYSPLHEASEEKFVDTLNRIIGRKSAPSKLQWQRKKRGYTQKALAEKSRVNLRTLQQYELKTKDICKASVQTVIALSAALDCKIEDLLESIGGF